MPGLRLPDAPNEHNQSPSAQPALPSRILSSRTSANEFPAAYFIDPEVFRIAQMEFPRVNMSVQQVIGELAGSISDIQSSSTTYFNTVHKWMPIVSKRQFYATLLHRMTTRRAELLLLTLSMKLSSSNVEVAETDLYRAVKQLHFEAESCGTLSILVLQAGVIIALYELGHAIYPAAYLSVGRCARYAIGLGLDQTASTVGEMKLPWNEEEECRRVWWSILILDRLVIPPCSFPNQGSFKDHLSDGCRQLPESVRLRTTAPYPRYPL